MSQVTIRNLSDDALSALRRRAAGQGRALASVLREILESAAAGSKGGGSSGVIREEREKRGMTAGEALAKMERVWESWESEPRVAGCSSGMIREEREKRWPPSVPKSSARKRGGRGDG